MIRLLGACLLLALASANQETNLVQSILSRYTEADELSRPVASYKDKVKVNLAMTLVRLDHFNDVSDTLTADVFLTMTWTDARLKWNAETYDGLSHITLPADKIWLPDLVQYNGGQDLRDRKFQSYIMADGTVMFVPAHALRLTCTEAEDVYTCKSIIGSWVLNGHEIDLPEPSLDNSMVEQNPDWEIIETKAERNVKHYDMVPDPYVDNTFTITIKRRH